MNSSHLDRHYTRTDLFLVRIWTRGAEGIAGDDAGVDGDSADDGAGKPEWRGTVQRAVDGEVHKFSSRQGLLDLLVVMLSNNRGR